LSLMSDIRTLLTAFRVKPRGAGQPARCSTEGVLVVESYCVGDIIPAEYTSLNPVSLKFKDLHILPWGHTGKAGKGCGKTACTLVAQIQRNVDNRMTRDHAFDGRHDS